MTCVLYNMHRTMTAQIYLKQRRNEGRGIGNNYYSIFLVLMSSKRQRAVMLHGV